MVSIKTGAPRGLLASIRQAIDKGHVKTWTYDSDGDFTHTPTQWSHKAWLRPTISSNGLTLEILNNKNVPFTTEIYGVYHGRFIEMILAHFRSEIIDASAN